MAIVSRAQSTQHTHTDDEMLFVSCLIPHSLVSALQSPFDRSLWPFYWQPKSYYMRKWCIVVVDSGAERVRDARIYILRIINLHLLICVFCDIVHKDHDDGDESVRHGQCERQCARPSRTI